MADRIRSCELCQRTPRKGTTEHHLIPRTCHRNKWFKKRHFNTVGKLLAHEPIARFVEWARKQK